MLLAAISRWRVKRDEFRGSGTRYVETVLEAGFVPRFHHSVTERPVRTEITECRATHVRAAREKRQPSTATQRLLEFDGFKLTFVQRNRAELFGPRFVTHEVIDPHHGIDE